MTDEIERLREEIRAVDRALVDLTARRLALARRVGELKQSVGAPIRNYVVEADAIRLVREAAEKLGVRPQLAEELLKLEIQESLRVQEKDRVVRNRPAGTTGRALVVGGAGNMGRWFTEFLESKGYEVTISDPRGPVDGRPYAPDPLAAAARADLVLLATPPSATGALLKGLAGRASGIVMDIASLKAPHLEALRELASTGARVGSIHPMWGPSTELLAGKNLVVCDCGSPEANALARRLFADTAANLVEMPLDEHDRFMGLVLGLPHAANLVFGHALSHLSPPFEEVSNLGGPTFQKQVAVSREVASENKDLYFEIQKLNPHTGRVLAEFRRSLDDLEASLAERARFQAYMAEAEAYYGKGAKRPTGGKVP